MAFLNKRAAFKRTSFVVKDDYKTPAYNVSSKGHTVFRLFPAPAEGGGFDPQIVPVDGDPLEGLSNSFAEVEMVDWFGKDKLSFITTCSDINSEENVSPCLMFYNKIQDFTKAESKKAVAGQPFCKALTVWNPWFADAKGIASLPQTRMLLQGVLIDHAGEKCKDKDGNIQVRVPVVLCLNRSATMDMEEKLVTKKSEADDLSATNSLIGDISGLKTGSCIKVSSYKNKEKQTRYQVEPVPGAYELDEAMVHAHFVPWEDLLNIQSASYQIDKLVEQFSAEAVDYAFRDDAIYGPMIPDSVVGSFEKAFGEGAAEKPAPTTTATPTGMADSPASDPAPAQDAEEVPMNFDDSGKTASAPADTSATNDAMAIAMEAAKKSQSK